MVRKLTQKFMMVILGTIWLQAQAIPVEDVNEWRITTMSYVKEVMMLENQLTQIGQLTVQIDDLDKNLKPIEAGQQIWDGASGDLDSFNQAMRGGDQAINFAKGGDVDNQYKQAFPGFQPEEGPSDYSAISKKSIQSDIDTLNGHVVGLNKSMDILKKEEGQINQIRDEARRSQGGLHALQISNEIAVEQVVQLQKVRQLMMSNANAQDIHNSQIVEKEAYQQETTDFVVKKAGNYAWQNYKDNPDFGQIPEF